LAKTKFNYQKDLAPKSFNIALKDYLLNEFKKAESIFLIGSENLIIENPESSKN
jgi:hypothetical protein